MVEFNSLVVPLVWENLPELERSYLINVFERYEGYPSLQQLWQLMDEQWQARLRSTGLDERVNAFYRHPVWLLNGLYIEQDPRALPTDRLLAG